MKKSKSNLAIVRDYLDGVRPFIQTGYSGPPSLRKDGEVWTDSKGIKWKKEKDKVSRINEQADLIRNAVRSRSTSCNKDMRLFGDKYDDKVYGKTGLCYDCLIEKETTYRVLNVYDDYEKMKIYDNQYNFLNELKVYLESVLEDIKRTNGDYTHICNGEGHLEIFRMPDDVKRKVVVQSKWDLRKVKRDMRNVKKFYDAHNENFTKKLKENGIAQ